MIKKFLKRNKIDSKYALAAIIGYIGGTFIVTRIELLTGFYNTYFFLFFAFIYSFMIFKKFDKLFHTKLKEKGDLDGNMFNIQNRK